MESHIHVPENEAFEFDVAISNIGKLCILTILAFCMCSVLVR